MAERVESIDVDVRWEPNAPEAYLLVGDAGDVVLALNAHEDDPDRRCVVLSWSGARAASMGAPNDEALDGHRLFNEGLRELLWIGVVRDSELVRDLERRNRVHHRHDPAQFVGLTHYIIALKETLVEVVARDLQVGRIDGATKTAAADALG